LREIEFEEQKKACRRFRWSGRVVATDGVRIQ